MVGIVNPLHDYAIMLWIAIAHEAISLHVAETLLPHPYLAVTMFHESDIFGDVNACKYELCRFEVERPDSIF